VGNTGRKVVEILSLGAIHPPLLDATAFNIALRKPKSAIGWLIFALKWFVLADLYFLLGLAFWSCAILVPIVIIWFVFVRDYLTN